MPKLSNSVPKYRRHKASGQAIVTLAGKNQYLGPYGTKASRLEYDRLISEWVADGRPVFGDKRPDSLSINELLAAFLRVHLGLESAVESVSLTLACSLKLDPRVMRV